MLDRRPFHAGQKVKGDSDSDPIVTASAWVWEVFVDFGTLTSRGRYAEEMAVKKAAGEGIDVPDERIYMTQRTSFPIHQILADSGWRQRVNTVS